MLFSATLPKWVAEVAQRFLKPDRVTVDLVGSSTMKASAAVRHLLINCNWQERTAIIGDMVRARAPAGQTPPARVIVFTETKKDAQEVSEHLQGSLSSEYGARALHGDIPQAAREKTLADFRAGRFSVLVATDVAVVSSLTMHFPANGGASTTRLHFVGLRGAGDLSKSRELATNVVYESSARPADHKASSSSAPLSRLGH